MISVTLPIRTVSESNRRGHWSKHAGRTRGQRALVARTLSSCAMVTGVALEKCHHVVTLTRIAPRKLDDDNLRGCLKACRDGAADWLGIQDNDPRVSWKYAQERGDPHQYAVRVAVAPRDPSVCGECGQDVAPTTARTT